MLAVAIALIKECFPPKPKFNIEDMPDLTGKVAIVTGANTGIGKETAKALLDHNATVYIACRSKSKAEIAIAELKKQTGRDAVFLQLDLGDLRSIKSSAGEFLSKESKLDILFNNAGVMQPPIHQLTSQGYDLQFGTNTLGPFYFTKCLIPALSKAAKLSPDGKSRVVNTASSSAYMHTTVDFDTLKDTETRRTKALIFLYGQSKFGNIVFSNEFARRYGEQGIVSTSLNPGNIQTDLYRTMGGLSRKILNKLVLHPASTGALTQIWAGTMPECAEYNGQFLAPWARLRDLPPGTDDLVLGQRLWDWFEEQVKDV